MRTDDDAKGGTLSRLPPLALLDPPGLSSLLVIETNGIRDALAHAQASTRVQRRPNGRDDKVFRWCGRFSSVQDLMRGDGSISGFSCVRE